MHLSIELRHRDWIITLGLVFLLALSAGAGAEKVLPIIDTHVHYIEDAWLEYPPEIVMYKMRASGVRHALVSSSPDEGTRQLFQLDQQLVVPFLRPYQQSIGPRNWYRSTAIIDYFSKRLASLRYIGIGEFHLHADVAADAQGVRKTVELATERDLYLHVHSNAAVIRAIFAYAPEAKILWAHAGLAEPPEVVAEMLDQYRKLWVDTSIREHGIAPGGRLDDAWRALFLRHPDRITIGSDTWIPSRWGQYQELIDFNRQWLTQLPFEIAEQIAYRNAQGLFILPIGE